jgi:hypothetical protein
LAEKTSFGLVEESVRSLTRVNKVTVEYAPTFITKFMKKYNIQKGNEKKLLDYCLDEINKMNFEK